MVGLLYATKKRTLVLVSEKKIDSHYSEVQGERWHWWPQGPEKCQWKSVFFRLLSIRVLAFFSPIARSKNREECACWQLQVYKAQCLSFQKEKKPFLTWFYIKRIVVSIQGSHGHCWKLIVARGITLWLAAHRRNPRGLCWWGRNNRFYYNDHVLKLCLAHKQALSCSGFLVAF